MSETHGTFCPFNKGDCYRSECAGGSCAANGFISKGPLWVSTDERKPEDERWVLGYWPGSGDFMPAIMESVCFSAWDAPDGPEQWRDWNETIMDAPTHWMPLPEAPK